MFDKVVVMDYCMGMNRCCSLEDYCKHSGCKNVADSRSFDVEVHRKMNDMQRDRAIAGRIPRLAHPW